jgi:hypothetical protein
MATRLFVGIRLRVPGLKHRVRELYTRQSILFVLFRYFPYAKCMYTYLI